MKTIGKILLSLLLIFSFVYTFSCSDNVITITPEKEIEFVAKQIPGCNRLSKLSRNSNPDSCFTYSFTDTLKLDFCVFGNCCPDSNRFVSSYTINSDTIFVTVLDTAENNCRCFCNYNIELQMFGLQNEQYLFYCKLDSLFEYNEIVKK